MNFTQQIEELDRRTDAEARKRHAEGHKRSAVATLRQMWKAFREVYDSQNARRDGVPGLFRAVQAGMFHFLSYAKHWELERNAPGGA